MNISKRTLMMKHTVQEDEKKNIIDVIQILKINCVRQAKVMCIKYTQEFIYIRRAPMLEYI